MIIMFEISTNKSMTKRIRNKLIETKRWFDFSLFKNNFKFYIFYYYYILILTLFLGNKLSLIDGKRSNDRFFCNFSLYER